MMSWRIFFPTQYLLTFAFSDNFTSHHAYQREPWTTGGTVGSRVLPLLSYPIPIRNGSDRIRYLFWIPIRAVPFKLLAPIIIQNRFSDRICLILSELSLIRIQNRGDTDLEYVVQNYESEYRIFGILKICCRFFVVIPILPDRFFLGAYRFLKIKYGSSTTTSRLRLVPLTYIYNRCLPIIPKIKIVKWKPLLDNDACILLILQIFNSITNVIVIGLRMRNRLCQVRWSTMQSAPSFSKRIRHRITQLLSSALLISHKHE